MSAEMMPPVRQLLVEATGAMFGDLWYLSVRWPLTQQTARSGWVLTSDLAAYATLSVGAFCVLTQGVLFSSAIRGVGDPALDLMLLVSLLSLPLGLGLACTAAVLRAMAYGRELAVRTRQPT